MAPKSKNNKKKKTPQKKQKSSFGRFVFKWLFVLGLWTGIAVTGLVAWYGQELPEIAKTISFERKNAIIVKANDGSVLARYGEIQGMSVTTDELPSHLIHAVLAIEDRRFYDHFGIDLIGIARAMTVNARKKRFAQGGSTITQQLAKNLFLSRERTIKRKIQEALLALWLEHQLTKNEILSAYLNRVYFGAGTYGIDAATKVYFDKSVPELTLQESAILAGLLKAPSRFSPLHNPTLARQRARVVIKAMIDAGYITERESEERLKGQLPRPMAKPGTPRDNERYFTDWIVDGLDDLIGTPTEDIIVETTLNPKIQKHTQEALVNTLQEHSEERLISQGAVIVMRPDGQIVSMLGGRDYSQSQFNRAVQAKRQPGSSFKPIVYLSALENGWEPDTLIMDEPIEQGRYRPKNFGNEYYGEVMLSDALMLSLNTVAFHLMKEMHPDTVIDMAKRLGIHSKLERDLSLALGSSSVSPLELTTAYATLSNGGLAVFPYAITRITSAEGELYYQRPRYQKTRRVVDAEKVFKLTQMMKRVLTDGTGRAAHPGFPAAGKTGTSQDSRDAWFAGFSDELVAVVWLGNDDNSPMDKITGGSFPARIWGQIMANSQGRYGRLRNSFLDENATIPADFNNLIGRLISPSHSDRRYYRRGESGSSNTHQRTRRYND